MKIGVAEEENEILEFLQENVRQMGGVFQVEKVAAGGQYDLLLVAPRQIPAGGCVAHTLIVHEEDAAEAALWVAASSIVTYGTERSTLAISSLEEVCMIAVQREIVDRYGHAIEIGELQMKIPPYFGPTACMVAGALRLMEMQREEEGQNPFIG